MDLSTDFWKAIEDEIKNSIPQDKQSSFLQHFRKNHSEVVSKMNLEQIDSFAHEALKFLLADGASTSRCLS